MIIKTDGHSQKNAVQNTALLFFPLSGFSDDSDGRIITSTLKTEDGISQSVAVIEDNGKKTEVSVQAKLDEKCDEAALVSKAVWLAGREHTGISPAWGTVTGIRAAKFIRQKRKIMTSAEIADIYCVREDKIKLSEMVCESEDKALSKLDGKSVSLYISIPFCPSRCYYCSFVSHSIEKAGALIPDYVKALCNELEEVKKVCDKTGVNVSTVYMGGGTPTTLTAGQMDTVLSKVDELFDVSTLDEFTVEAGRPDTITEEKLDVLRKCGVTRISINPQTMNDKTLEKIGRRHTSNDVLLAYELAKSKGFDCINTDLIAGLDTEDEKDFDFTLEKILSMRPENVTVHTLSVKRAANLRDDGGKAIDRAAVTEYMTETAQKRLLEAGYRPYYMYKQKNMVGNLENVGYALDDKDGLYNIYIMGEYQTIIAVGAGAVSKVVNAKNGRIERVFNYKYPYEYLDDPKKMLGNIVRLEELIRETL